MVTAARAGASEVGRAVIASTVTTVCVFVPIVFVEGIAGQLFGDQALTVTFSLLVSLVVALTVIPMLASRTFDWSREDETVEGASSRATRWVQERIFAVAVTLTRLLEAAIGAVARIASTLVSPLLAGFDRCVGGVATVYQRLLDRALVHRLVTVLSTLVLMTVSLLLFGDLGRELVPELVQGELFVNTELPPGSRLEVTERRMIALERVALGQPAVKTVYSIIGSSNEQGGVAGERRENIGQLTLTLEPPVSRAREEALMENLRRALDEQNRPFLASVTTAARSHDGENAIGGPSRGLMEYRFGRPSYFSFRTPVEVELRGYNLELLERLAAQVVARMRRIEGLADVKSSTEGGNPELQIVFDRERLAAYGYTITEVGQVVRSKIQGEIATDINREDRNIDIRLRADERYRDSVRDLRNLNVRRSGTTPLPLSAVAEVIETEGPAEIRRSDGSRVATITANLMGRDLGSVSDEIEAVLSSLALPPGFDWSLGGQRQEMETSFDSMRLAILLAVFMVYLVMASQFESLLHPFVILFSVPFSVIGALVMLWLTDTAVSIVVLIGAILLAGIVVNNAIILIDYTNRLRSDGMAKIEALKQAGMVRLRPILMTTSTTVLGLLPMAVGFGEGSELRSPMALTVVGGLLTSTVLTLLIVPVVYSLLDRGR
jgi:HAE1 family hydrophobic/amphiphilic exporter-1